MRKPNFLIVPTAWLQGELPEYYVLIMAIINNHSNHELDIPCRMKSVEIAELIGRDFDDVEGAICDLEENNLITVDYEDDDEMDERRLFINARNTEYGLASKTLEYPIPVKK